MCVAKKKAAQRNASCFFSYVIDVKMKRSKFKSLTQLTVYDKTISNKTAIIAALTLRLPLFPSWQ